MIRLINRDIVIKNWTKFIFFKKQQVPLLSSQPSAEPLENIALGKRVTQSSTAFGGDARRAVDGKLDGNYGHNSVLIQISIKTLVASRFR